MYGDTTQIQPEILPHTETLEEHRRVVRQVLQILREHKLTCKPEKCEFKTVETEYLGHIIAQGVVKMDPAKVAGVTEWPVPRSKIELQSFLGFANFYRRFIGGFALVDHVAILMNPPSHGLAARSESSWLWSPGLWLRIYCVQRGEVSLRCFDVEKV